jgi:hypothetical protein
MRQGMNVRNIALILFTAAGLSAQANTADFNSLVAGTSYSSGALFINGGLTFDMLYGSGNLNVVAASNPINPSFTGNYLNLTSAVLLNVNLPTGASQIQFDFIQNNPAEALIINGAFINFDQIPTTVNGVTITQLLGSKTNPWGSITATGGINTFEILGNLLGVDNVNATLSPGLAGDYNKNHVVDAADYALWRKNLNSRSGYNSWRANFGSVGGSGTAVGSANGTVPEPYALPLLIYAVAAASATRMHLFRRSAVRGEDADVFIKRGPVNSFAN